jgi:hypothetical protein
MRAKWVSVERAAHLRLRNRTETLLDHQTSTLEQASAPVSAWSQRTVSVPPSYPPDGYSSQLQRAVGNRPVTQVLTSRAGGGLTIQRHVADKAYEAMGKHHRPSEASTSAVRLYKRNAKKTKKTAWIEVLRKAKEQDGYWAGIRDHVIPGDATSPPKRLHGTKYSDHHANSEPVGDRSPVSAGESVIYKQWARRRGDRTYDHLQIFSFFPGKWPEQKIQTAILFNNAGIEHEVDAPFALTCNDGTTFRRTTCNNAEQPDG